jgi:hypothetical protein
LTLTCTERGSPIQIAEEAAVSLDSGRGIIIGRLLELRTEFQGLPADIVEEYNTLRAILDPPLDMSQPLLAERIQSQNADRRHAASVRYDDLVAKIRQFDGFEDFGLQLRAEMLKRQAAKGPIVMVNTSVWGCDALIVTLDQIERKPLSMLDLKIIEKKVEIFRHSLKAIQKLSSKLPATQAIETKEKAMSDGTKIAEHEALLIEVLEWLWETVAEPVLRHLGYTTTPTEEEKWPHVWWSPSGILSLLPIHAAGRHKEDRAAASSVIDRVVSSYTSTIRTLKYSRDKSSSVNSGRTFLAAMPSTPGQKKLRSAKREVLGVKLLTSKMGRYSDITVAEKGISVEEVKEQLPNVEIAHFVCHAIFDGTNPSASKLLFIDGTISVSQISQMKIKEGALVYLSACSTANSGAKDLEDESISLTSSFQLAGFSRVVGTLWDSMDHISHNVALSFYTYLNNDLERSALALHKAVLEEREGARTRPSIWAPYIYTGA